MSFKDPNSITGIVLDACIKIHNVLGPGLFESVYAEVLIYELTKRSLSVQKQKPIPLIYDGIKFEDGFRADLFVENMVIIEVKSIDSWPRYILSNCIPTLNFLELRMGYWLTLILTC